MRHRFAETEAEQNLAQATAAMLQRAQPAGQRALRHRLAKALVAVMPRHFLDDVDFRRAVGTPRRSDDSEVAALGRLGGEPDRSDDCLNGFGVEGCAEQCTDSRRPHRHHVGPGQVLGTHVNSPSVHHQIGTRQTQQLNKPRASTTHAEGINTTLESRRRLAAQTQALHACHDLVGFEPRHFQCNRGGRIADL